MYEIIRNSVGYNKIKMMELRDYQDQTYYHPFVGGLAISRRLKSVLWDEFAFDCMCQDVIPSEFFQKYYIVHVWPAEDYDVRYRTSSQWASCILKESVPDIPPMEAYTEDDAIERIDSDMCVMFS